MTTTKKASLWFGIRQLIYLAGCFAVILIEHLLATRYHGETFHEHCIIENLQLCELLLTTLLFCISWLRQGVFAKLMPLFAGLCAFAACRELDCFLGNHIPTFGWKIGVIFPIASVAYALKDWKETQRVIFLFLRHPSFELMLCAMILILPVAQCIGHKSFLLNVLEEEHIGRIKELLEESLETIGYFVLLCSSIELLVKHKKQPLSQVEE